MAEGEEEPREERVGIGAGVPETRRHVAVSRVRQRVGEGEDAAAEIVERFEARVSPGDHVRPVGRATADDRDGQSHQPSAAAGGGEGSGAHEAGFGLPALEKLVELRVGAPPHDLHGPAQPLRQIGAEPGVGERTPFRGEHRGVDEADGGRRTPVYGCPAGRRHHRAGAEAYGGVRVGTVPASGGGHRQQEECGAGAEGRGGAAGAPAREERGPQPYAHDLSWRWRGLDTPKKGGWPRDAQARRVPGRDGPAFRSAYGMEAASRRGRSPGVDTAPSGRQDTE